MSSGILAFDFGASSGRAMLSRFENGQINIEEMHRFSNDPVKVGKTLYWDILRLFHDVKLGMIKAHHAGGFDSIGIDTWGVDFGLLDSFGNLLENPVHYRDERFIGMLERVHKIISPEELYAITGIQEMDINTICQLYYLKENRPDLLERAQTLLFMPDLIRYMLTGVKSTEYTIASTSQLVDAKTKDWSWEIIEKLGLPKKLFTEIIQPGTVAGELTLEIQKELSLPPSQVIAVAEHDTASAVASVPTDKKDFIYVSCGTWSLFGTELQEPCLTETAERYNITNEGGYDNTIRFLKNISGLWMIQEARREWMRQGKDYSYAELEKQALAVEPFKCFVNTDYPSFSHQGDHPRRVQDFCKETGQFVPQTVGEIMRCIYESLAFKYRYTFEQIKEITKNDYENIHIVGGGTKDNLLCQMTADATNQEVIAGPIEATVLGNVMVQMISKGEIASAAEGRRLIGSSQKLFKYSPKEHDVWETAYADFVKILK